MANSEQCVEGGGLRVRFLWQRDRYVHEIWSAAGPDWMAVLRSIEGSPQEDWPASPPLQSLHLESRPGNRQLALLVGMAGKSHWSVSIELDPDAGRLKFDVACRVRVAEPISLGSCYQALLPECRTQTEGELAIVGIHGHAQLGLQACHDLGPAKLELRDGQIKIAASPVASATPSTLRWGYEISRRGNTAGELP